MIGTWPAPHLPAPLVRDRSCIVTFTGMQALDLVGPFEVFAGATRSSCTSVRGAARTTCCRRRTGADGAHRERARRSATEPLPGPDEPIDTLLLPGGGRGARRTARRRAGRLGARRIGRSSAPSGHACAPGRSSPPPPACSTGAPSPPTGPGPSDSPREHPAVDGRPRPDLHPRRRRVDVGRRHRRDRPRPRPGRGGPRHRGGPDRRPLAGDVPAPTRRPVPVRRAGVGAAGAARPPSVHAQDAIEAEPGGRPRASTSSPAARR